MEHDFEGTGTTIQRVRDALAQGVGRASACAGRRRPSWTATRRRKGRCASACAGCRRPSWTATRKESRTASSANCAGAAHGASTAEAGVCAPGCACAAPPHSTSSPVVNPSATGVWGCIFKSRKPLRCYVIASFDRVYTSSSSPQCLIPTIILGIITDGRGFIHFCGFEAWLLHNSFE
jgi:hypothetical protein